ncbi:hypothetical protein VITU102760_25640 [Vibrio tubiashii]|uniref:Uncharacterized protein n=1 Tax=Vibrio tubiashii ATCC 19109 TaxID=1051646 RepID=F9T3H8_9VIBR|nr:hypothetical protein [Vibrio tubiashii]AIW14100.1 hypothetical protein IX91_07780 [Vibrio tubiashii ATCC 19109]EGU57035.1 hypothetical protein VITU9109_11830 [Vibrio tubiashii ATCC 19109]EIF04571.1 hypothetical protein VT1337_07851 [Vibrio tubiashii NCIMB 1337 = ATCC 19106]
MSKQKNYKHIYENMLKVLPDKPWVKSYSNIISGGKSPSLPTLMNNSLVYGLHLYETRGDLLKDNYEHGIVAEAMSTCNAFLYIYSSLGKDNKNQILKRFQSAFFQPNDMRAINYELFMCFYLTNQGHEIEIKDNDISGDTYDFLIKTNDNEHIQLECKSFSYDKGLYVSGEDASDIYKAILSQDHGLVCNIDNQVTVYSIEIEQGVPKNKTTKEEFVTEIIKLLHSPSEESDCKIKVHRQIYDDVANISDVDSHLDLPIKNHGVEVGRIASSPNGNSGRFCLIITTHVKGSLQREFENVCKRAAKEQLPSTRASCISVEISNSQVFSFFEGNRSIENKIRNIFKQRHLTSILLFNNTQGEIASDGTHFYMSPLVKEFKNSNSKFFDTSSLKSVDTAI